MRWTHEPPNPLQHESEKMTKEHYSAKGVDTLQAIQQRCLKKYYKVPGKHQDWMDEVMNQMKQVSIETEQAE